jgi:hypothetical protein
MSTLTAQTIDLYAGEAHVLSVAVTKSGVAIDLAGRTLTFEAKRAVPDAAADISASSAGAGAAIVVTNAAGGLAEIRFTTTLTAWKDAYGSRKSNVAMTWDLWDSASPEPIATGPLTLWRLPQS